MSSSSRHIGIFEPNSDGHRLTYVQYLAEYAHLRQYSVTLITTQAAFDSDNYKLHLAHLCNYMQIHIVKDAEHLNPEAYSKALKLDLTVIPDGDNYAWKALWHRGWRGHGQLSLLIMRPRSQNRFRISRTSITLFKYVLFRICRSRSRVNILTLQSSLWDHGKSSFGVPDPISFNPQPESLETHWKVSKEREDIDWIGVVGAISPRKNVPLVLDAIMELNSKNIGLVLAGKIDQSIRPAVFERIKKLEDKGVTTVVMDTLLTDGQLDAAVERLHIVVLAHSNEGASGILGKAVEAGTYAVTAGANSLRKDSDKIPGASTWSGLDKDEIRDSLQNALDAPRPSPKHLNTMEVFSRRLITES